MIATSQATRPQSMATAIGSASATGEPVNSAIDCEHPRNNSGLIQSSSLPKNWNPTRSGPGSGRRKPCASARKRS
jgi:hypothetical protein